MKNFKSPRKIIYNLPALICLKKCFVFLFRPSKQQKKWLSKIIIQRFQINQQLLKFVLVIRATKYENQVSINVSKWCHLVTESLKRVAKYVFILVKILLINTKYLCTLDLTRSWAIFWKWNEAHEIVPLWFEQTWVELL